MTDINDLPKDLVQQIGSYLSPTDRAQLRQTSAAMKNSMRQMSHDSYVFMANLINACREAEHKSAREVCGLMEYIKSCLTEIRGDRVTGARDPNDWLQRDRTAASGPLGEAQRQTFAAQLRVLESSFSGLQGTYLRKVNTRTCTIV